ncbi:MAG: hypothetical protein RL266_1746 [Bacteroidota bacterium]
MKKLLFIAVLASIVGCKTDVLVPCEETGMEGYLCREYRYFNGLPQGFVEFEQEGDSVFSSLIFDQNLNWVKTTKEHYISGQLSVVSEQFPDKDTRVRTYHYNELDSLALIVYGPNDSSLEIEYAEGKRLRETLVKDGLVTHYSEFRYFQDDGLLYRISMYDGNDSLLNYRNFDYFSSNESSYYRVTFYSSTFEFLGRTRYSFSQYGLISSMEHRLANGELTNSRDYIYNATGKLTEEHRMLAGNILKSVYLYY